VTAGAETALAERLRGHGQEHVLRFWDDLSEEGRSRLARQLEAVDLDELDRLVETLVRRDPEPSAPLDRLRPPAVHRVPADDETRRRREDAARAGAAALAAGEVAVVVVAGGQGTRLGFDGPKGLYPIGPVAGTTLFEIHAEKVRALERRHGASIPLYVMTSPANHRATADWFDAHAGLGLSRVRLFTQGTMPAVDARSGRLLLAERDSLALSPDGHGGTIRALAAAPADGGSSVLDELAERGVRTIFYFQVDNPLVAVADAAFLGLHRRTGADISSKVVEKREPREKVGLVCDVDGRHEVIEYSDLPDDLAERRRPDGGLALWAGSIAVHALERSFVERLAGGGPALPFHRALKKVPYVGDDGRPVSPQEPNGVKFETFIFDALPLAETSTLVETPRELEFEPLKNATGSESPESVRRALAEIWAGWLEAAGARVVRDADGAPPPIEISPLVALDAAELREHVAPGLVVDGPFRLG
jgi:UDP-N-acetylglucosamine/UDP-N-acetylgalactosamine diphosphorylase